MTEDVLIRDALASDADEVSEIYNHYVRESVVTFDEEEGTPAEWREKHERLRGAGLPFLVAVDRASGRVLGYALAQPWRVKSAYRYTVEDSIYLGPDAAGRGIGRELLVALVDASRVAGLRQMIAVITGSGAEASIALHAKLGFVETGRLSDVGVKFGRTIGVVLLQKEL
ncbi:phosphinothricin acetyltransferase [Microbacterium resistens]|uniref:Phosphinothricin acetyltransferase n=1 Tax=Microbacterium resistens TaxID=156977 RepID=A0ABU1S9W9_9MICO|nr:N-acetyltransferase family protein [Microbacterium resistens]MDR6866401.1 phosphinothricin acetyltransferase [Microbacterium resistens]